MKKFRSVLSLVLAVVLMADTIAPAFADDPYCTACYNGNDFELTIQRDIDGNPLYATSRHTCVDDVPYVWFVESYTDGWGNYKNLREFALERKNAGISSIYYCDENGQYWTDMPEYGGAPVSKEEVLGGLFTLPYADKLAEIAAGAPVCDGCRTGEDFLHRTENGVIVADRNNHTCGKKVPYIWYVESERSTATGFLYDDLLYTGVYYCDPDGSYWTDMPEYGGTPVSKEGVMDGTAPGMPVPLSTWWNSYRPSYYYNATVANTASVGFTDVPDNAWYADAVNALANTDILHGDGQGHFLPDGVITWQQMYWLLEHLLGVNGKRGYLPTSTDTLQAHEIAGAMMGWANKVLPANDTTPVTRAEAISIVATLYSLRDDHERKASAYADATGDKDSKGWYTWANGAIAQLALEAVADGAVEYTSDMIPDFAELKAIATSTGVLRYDADYDFSIHNNDVRHGQPVVNPNNILRAYTLGLVSGTDSKGTLAPNGTLTRAEFCQMLYNAGIFGYIGPHTLNFAVTGGTVSFSNDHVYDLEIYMRTHYTDGTPVED